MCGIVGFFPNLSGDKSVDILRNMLTRIKHRGPDESGVYISDKVALGSVRLSIIDLKSGTMPICNEDGTLWIVFNGEIFNYLELRQELLDLGHSFKTQSDTEVVLHLYEEFGPDFLKRLNGQFAISIWDKNKEELFLARDRVGIRPLFYTYLDGSFVFASEIKSFLEFPEIELELSPKSLIEYFTFWAALSPNTAFKNVFEVPPGYYMIINSMGKETFSYWELPLYSNEEKAKYNNVKDAALEFERIFSDSVKLRLRADVTVAAYLSGGIDSSVTTAFINQIKPKNLKTFSIGFSDKDFDESFYQNVASNFFKSDHNSITCDAKEIADNFKDIVWHVETPLLRTSPVPMSLLAKNVKENNIKVVITGEGADELLGGYNIFKETKIRRFWSKYPDSTLRPLLLKKLYPYLPVMKNTKSNMLKMFFGYKLEQTGSPIYSHLLRWNNNSKINNYLSDEFKKSVGNHEPIEQISKSLDQKFKDCDYLSKAQWIEMNIFMSGYLLSSQGDRMAMANSIEGRYPFLDHRLIEFCMKLPSDLKLNGLNEKYLLKKMIKGRIPSKILNRSKQAYRSPIKSAFVSDKIPEYIKKLLSSEEIKKSGIFNEHYVERLFFKMNNKKLISEIDNMALTAIISVQILNDLFVKKSISNLNAKNLVKLDKIIIEQ